MKLVLLIVGENNIGSLNQRVTDDLLNSVSKANKGHAYPLQTQVVVVATSEFYASPPYAAHATSLSCICCWLCHIWTTSCLFRITIVQFVFNFCLFSYTLFSFDPCSIAYWVIIPSTRRHPKRTNIVVWSSIIMDKIPWLTESGTVL